ncbi:MAG: diguanylate cyclase [Pseudomonas sp.]|uniref:diguanylate cyclase domain-containing protein n=1 Tax=Pseudomonas sp. TaxID=306 RepID=UPI00339129D5
MNELPGRSERAAQKAARELAHLLEQTDEARGVLALLQQHVAATENRLVITSSSQLVEANAQLVVSMLRSQVRVDKTERQLKEALHLAEFDALTGLPNRSLLLDRVKQAISVARRHNRHLALLFLDLNNFKQINDTLGHAVGDQVLKRAAECFVGAVRDADTVSRHGGDEFLILLSEVSQAADAALIAEKIIAALGAPRRVGEHVLRLTASIGISLFPEDGEQSTTLIDHADAAMYRAKRLGLGSYVFYGDEPSNEPQLEPQTFASLKRLVTHYELAQAEHERQHLQLREANENLLLAALGAQQLLAASEQALRQQKDLLAMVAHELRNPLTPLSIAAGRLDRVRKEELPRMQALIERQVQQMVRLVEDLLDVSRIQTGKLRIERQDLDLAVCIDQALDACRPAMDTRLQLFSVHLPNAALGVFGDPLRLTQVLSNLLDNASKYTPNGGTITLSVSIQEQEIVLSVVDSGIGISAAALPDIFQPFVQDSQAIGFNGVGLGIGLTVVRELVEAHDGSVVASSEGSGCGCQFVVRLPLIEL